MAILNSEIKKMFTDREAEVIDIEALKKWAQEYVSEKGEIGYYGKLLKARLAEGFSWRELAMKEFLSLSLPGFESWDYEGLYYANPSLEALNELKKWREDKNFSRLDLATYKAKGELDDTYECVVGVYRAFGASITVKKVIGKYHRNDL